MSIYFSKRTNNFHLWAKFGFFFAVLINLDPPPELQGVELHLLNFGKDENAFQLRGCYQATDCSICYSK